MRLRLFSVLVLGAVVPACGAANKVAVEYRNKGRERFNEGKFDVALANYQKAEELDKKERIPDLHSERERASQEHARKRLKEAWEQYGHGNFLDAHKTLMAIDQAKAWGSKSIEQTVVRSMGDTAAMSWIEIDDLRTKKQYLRAMTLAESIVKPLPSTHSLRVRVNALRVTGIAYHLSKMKQLQTQYPAAAAFHYLIAQKLGADGDPDGLALLASVKRTTGDSATLAQQARDAASRGDGWGTENLLVQSRAVGSSWDSAAGKFFGGRYGLEDEKLLDDVWNGSGNYVAFVPPDPDKLPAADEVSIRIDPDGGGGDESGPRPKTFNLWFDGGTHMLHDSAIATGMGGQVRLPSKSGKNSYEMAGFVETPSFGGNVKGYGGEFLITRIVKPPVLAGIGIGYLEDERELMSGTRKQKSIHVPIIARVPIYEGYVAGLEYRANILQYTTDDPPPMDEPEHYSPLTLRLYGPVPLLGDAIKLFRNMAIEGYANYTPGASDKGGQDLSFGGRLIYRSGLGSSGSSGSGDKLWDKVENSVFAVQTLFGPTIDMWFSTHTSSLADDEAPFNNQTNGMGFMLRIPSRKESATEFTFWFDSSKLGGNVGGWGIEYLALKPIKNFGILGYGLGYSSSSISYAPESATPPPTPLPLPEENSFYSPIVLRFPLAATLIAALETRINYLQFGGSGSATMNADGTLDKRHLTPITARLWTPVPLLGDIASVFSKFHIEAHVDYTPKAVNEVTYGGMLVWRPIQEKR